MLEHIPAREDVLRTLVSALKPGGRLLVEDVDFGAPTASALAQYFSPAQGTAAVQRIYDLESQRAAGKRDDFPAPALDGYWLRSVAEHWARTRRRSPGPAPKPRADDQ